MKDIVVVIVLYKVKLEQCESYRSLVENISQKFEGIRIVVYDNSPESQDLPEISLRNNYLVHYKSDITNSGISRAYNYGAQYAMKLGGIKWLLFLDQDTTLPTDLFAAFVEAMRLQPQIKLFAPILKLSDGSVFSPCRYVFKRGFQLQKISPGVHSLRRLSPVNSGMLVELSAFLEVGGYNERVRLDFSDFQFIERFKRNFQDFYVIGSVLMQDFSNQQTDVNTLETRYRFFCDGAYNSTKRDFADVIMYAGVVFMRATTLFIRTKSFSFYKIFFREYLKR